jgi:hypothetical protein
VLSQRPAALRGGARATSLVCPGVQIGGPGLHDLVLERRLHRALLLKIGVGAAMRKSVPTLC